MKKISIANCSIISFVALLCLIAFSNQSYSQSLYDLNTIQKIEIVFSQSNWDYLLDTAKAGNETYLMAQSVTINGTKFDSVGVKYKGNSTYRAEQVKNPFHIELDTYKEQDYQGFKDIKLSNVAKDPSFVREVLSYSILRQYMDAPQSNYANVYVNGTLIGLYVSSESISKVFLNKHFGSKDNTFFKCNPLEAAGPGSKAFPNLVYLGPDSSNYSAAYEIKSDYGWNDLINLCNTLKNNFNEIEKVLDIDRALWMLAFDNATVNLDSYIGQFAQNYYLYKDNTGRFNCVVWDLNESLGTFSMTGTINLQNTTAKSQMTHLLHSGDANWPLVQKLLSNPSYRKMYLAHIHTILNENFANNSYYTTAQSILPIINSAVQADPNKFFSYSQYQSNLTNDVNSGGGPGGTSAPGITNLMNARYTYLSKLADFTNAKPKISNVIPSDSNPKINSSIFINANVINTNPNSVFLGYRSSANEKFTKVLMLDDGAHGDGAAGDNVYGASINASGVFIQYYIYAENDNVGMFAPERAEHEFYSINTEKSDENTSSILMNEIYARGTTEAPDWIEIFNSSSSEIDISGFKIYDSGGQSGSKPKKEFPSGSIVSPNGFIVIVTDDGSASAFGLSNSGENVWLENASGEIIDSVNFLAHTVTQSYGRLPNGGDSWQLLNTITRGASNFNIVGVKDENLNSSKVLSQNYPNPFSNISTIKYNVSNSGNVSIKLFDTFGNEITTLVNNFQEKGEYSIIVNSEELNLNSGIYFYKFILENYSEIKAMIISK